jgi:hypothetical protein
VETPKDLVKLASVIEEDERFGNIAPTRVMQIAHSVPNEIRNGVFYVDPDKTRAALLDAVKQGSHRGGQPIPEGFVPVLGYVRSIVPPVAIDGLVKTQRNGKNQPTARLTLALLSGQIQSATKVRPGRGSTWIATKQGIQQWLQTHGYISKSQ